MPKLIESPTIIEAAGNKPKIIREFIGRVNSNTPGVSIAHLISFCRCAKLVSPKSY